MATTETHFVYVDRASGEKLEDYQQRLLALWQAGWTFLLFDFSDLTEDTQFVAMVPTNDAALFNEEIRLHPFEDPESTKREIAAYEARGWILGRRREYHFGGRRMFRRPDTNQFKSSKLLDIMHEEGMEHVMSFSPDLTELTIVRREGEAEMLLNYLKNIAEKEGWKTIVEVGSSITGTPDKVIMQLRQAA